MNKTVQKAIRAEYAVLRTPLALLDERVLPRLGGSSRLRTTVGRGISKLDEVAARLLEPAPAASRASNTSEAEEIAADEVEELADELQERQKQEHNLVGELAEDDELRRVQAELMAKHRVEEQHEARH